MFECHGGNHGYKGKKFYQGLELTIKKQEESGLSVAEYCRNHEKSRGQFIYWKRKVCAAQRARTVFQEAGPHGFIEVHPAKSAGGGRGNDTHVEIRIGVFSIRFTDRTDRDLFRTAAAVLAGIAG